VVRTAFGAEDPATLQRLLVPLARPFMKSPEQGAATSISLASAPELEHVSGQYFADRRRKRSSVRSHDTAVVFTQYTDTLAYLREQGLPVPAVRPANDGQMLLALEIDGQPLRMRLLDYIDGQPLTRLKHMEPRLMAELGGLCARLDKALATFDQRTTPGKVAPFAGRVERASATFDHRTSLARTLLAFALPISSCALHYLVSNIRAQCRRLATHRRVTGRRRGGGGGFEETARRRTKAQQQE